MIADCVKRCASAKFWAACNVGAARLISVATRDAAATACMTGFAAGIRKALIIEDGRLPRPPPRRGNLQVSQVKSSPSEVKSNQVKSSHLRPLPSTTAGPLISRSRGCCDPRCEDAVDCPEKAICILPEGMRKPMMRTAGERKEVMIFDCDEQRQKQRGEPGHGNR